MSRCVRGVSSGGARSSSFWRDETDGLRASYNGGGSPVSWSLGNAAKSQDVCGRSESGSNNDSDVEITTTTTVPVKFVPTKLTTVPKSAVPLPPPKQAKRLKNATDLPKPNTGGDGRDDPEQPPTKKSRTDGRGAGVLGLLSMLPAPKQVVPAKPPGGWAGSDF